MKRLLVTVIVMGALLTLAQEPVYADSLGLLMRGLGKTVGAAFMIPAGMLANSTKAFPFGIVAGALIGSVNTVGTLLSGVVDMARGAAPYAKYMIFFI